jgi:hypothetical protein
VTVAVALDEYEAGIKTRGGDIGNVSQLATTRSTFPACSTS